MTRKKNRRKERTATLMRLCNLGGEEWQSRQKDFATMQPCDFLFQRLMSLLTQEDLNILMKAWSKERETNESRIIRLG